MTNYLHDNQDQAIFKNPSDILIILKITLSGKWDSMLQWLSNIVPLCPARHDVCSWVPHLSRQVNLVFLLMQIVMAVAFILSEIMSVLSTLQCNTWQLTNSPSIVGLSTQCQQPKGCKKYRCWCWYWWWQCWFWENFRAIGAPEEPDSFLLQSPLWP